MRYFEPAVCVCVCARARARTHARVCVFLIFNAIPHSPVLDALSSIPIKITLVKA